MVRMASEVFRECHLPNHTEMHSLFCFDNTDVNSIGSTRAFYLLSIDRLGNFIGSSIKSSYPEATSGILGALKNANLTAKSHKVYTGVYNVDSYTTSLDRGL